ncbi:MAG: hypothetical protein Q8Q08_13005 [Candidatus Omnitrophota bacterium]|nr:hypothetical protein [Candidatus Omnitrophota bacterium]
MPLDEDEAEHAATCDYDPSVCPDCIRISAKLARTGESIRDFDQSQEDDPSDEAD